MENEITWTKVFTQELDGLRTMIEDSLHYDTKQRCFVESSDPSTFSEIMFSAETDAFEQYDGMLPEWDDETEKLFQSEYLSKIKPIAEEWEAQIMYAAEKLDERENVSESWGETATEYYRHYFDRFWGRG